MKNETLYRKSVDILLDAYNEGSLLHGSCHACAVGNLVFRTGGFAGDTKVDGYLSRWQNVFCTNPGDEQLIDALKYKGKAKKEIDQTGYTWQELAQVESAFESNYLKDSVERTQYFGLCAVLDVLRDIHEVDKDSHDKSQERLSTIYKKLQEA